MSQNGKNLVAELLKCGKAVDKRRTVAYDAIGNDAAQRRKDAKAIDQP